MSLTEYSRLTYLIRSSGPLLDDSLTLQRYEILYLCRFKLVFFFCHCSFLKVSLFILNVLQMMHMNKSCKLKRRKWKTAYNWESMTMMQNNFYLKTRDMNNTNRTFNFISWQHSNNDTLLKSGKQTNKSAQNRTKKN